MKTHKLLILLVFATATFSALGQPIFLYDQQSAVEGAPHESGGIITTSQPFGQSFTPALNSVGFVRLWLRELAPGNGIGSTVYINLLTNSITGPILASTDPVFLPDGFGSVSDGYPDFLFSVPVPVTPGMTYFLQPVLQSGDSMIVFGDVTYLYSGGTAFIQGSARPFGDLWFREGIIVPEPSSAWLGLLGAGALGWWHRGKSRRNRPQPLSQTARVK